MPTFRKLKAAIVPAAGEPAIEFVGSLLSQLWRGQSAWGMTMKFPRRNFLRLAGAAAALPSMPRLAAALDYPTRPVHWMVGYAPGGGNDIVARQMGQWLSERTGQSFIIENRPGAATNVATEAVVNATPDGYTLLLAGLPNAINATLYDTFISISSGTSRRSPA